jgi:hypothetical protein
LHQEIRGKVNIYGSNISFPNLELIQGQLKIEARNKKDPDFEHDFPVLKKMVGNLTLNKLKCLFLS